MNPRALTNVLNVDAAANLAGGLALLLAAGWFAAPLGLDATWPLLFLGVALLASSSTLLTSPMCRLSGWFSFLRNV